MPPRHPRIFERRHCFRALGVKRPQWAISLSATSVQVPASIPNDDLPRSRGAGVYGYNWWLNGIKPNGQRLWPGAPPRTYYANGLHNNVCIVVPEWNMVIARATGAKNGGGTNTPPNVDEIWSGFLGRVAEAAGLSARASRPSRRSK